MIKPKERIFKKLVNPRPSLGITIFECGWSYRNKFSTIREDNWIRKDNILVCLLEGKGKLESASTGLRQLVPGNMFIIPSGVWHRYGPELEEEWYEYWIVFKGITAEALLFNATKGIYNKNACGLFNISINDEILRLFELLFAQAEQNRHDKCAVLFFEFLQKIERNIKREDKRTNFSIIGEVVAKIDSDPLINIDFKKEAAVYGISYALLRKEFLRHTGLPPYKYLLNQKIQYACNLLADGLNVKETCFEIGMKDPAHFSKLFKKITGIPPREFINRMFD